MIEQINLSEELKNNIRFRASEILRIILTCTILFPFILLSILIHDLKSLAFLLFTTALVIFLLRYDIKLWKLLRTDRENGFALRIFGSVDDLIKETYVIQRSGFIQITREVIVNDSYYEVNRKFYNSLKLGDQIELIVLPKSNRVIQGKIIEKAQKPTSIFDFSMQKEVVKNDLRNYR